MVHIADTVYSAFQQTFHERKEPGKSALEISLGVYAESLQISSDTLRGAIDYLHSAGRIHAIKLDYPAPIPEVWKITFPLPAYALPSYTVTAPQRKDIFAHALGWVFRVLALQKWEKTKLPLNGEAALDVFLKHANQYQYVDVRTVFNALPGDPYTDFIDYWNETIPFPSSR